MARRKGVEIFFLFRNPIRPLAKWRTACVPLQDNYLSKDELLAALQEVGVLNGIRARHVGEWG